MALLPLSFLAVPAVLVLIAFLSFSSQILFRHLEPCPLTRAEILQLNALVASMLISYYRAVTTDPGRLPRGEGAGKEAEDISSHDTPAGSRRRWCRKCNAPKPPRAHHCSTCQRCIPKMDHHCPWTINCISHVTYPHFIRFVFYAVIAMAYLWKLLWVRDVHLWRNRHLPSYLGPSVFQLVHLFLLNAANFLTFFALFILLVRSLWNLALNQTTIETWEIERHETLLRRARQFGGYLDGPNGQRVRIVRQEFPYDIGIFGNIAQGMGSKNPLSWFWPFSDSPSIRSGMEFETNGFEDPSVSWPPPDPDRMVRKPDTDLAKGAAFTYEEEHSERDRIATFRQRQERDMQRWQPSNGTVRKRKTFYKRFDEDGARLDDSTPEGDESGEEAWRNSEGERLQDFGVDEEADFYDFDDDDLPLAVIRERVKADTRINASDLHED